MKCHLKLHINVNISITAGRGTQQIRSVETGAGHDYAAKNSTTKTIVPTVKTIINTMKHSRSITAAASIHSRRIFTSLSDLSRFSSTIEILVSSLSSRFVSACSLGEPVSTADRSPLRLADIGSFCAIRPSMYCVCIVDRNDSKEASRSQISRLT